MSFVIMIVAHNYKYEHTLSKNKLLKIFRRCKVNLIASRWWAALMFRT